MSFPKEPLNQHLLKIQNWNPSKVIANEEFYYLDLGCVDKDNKVILNDHVLPMFGKDAPSRAKQIVKIRDVIVSTVRPNLNGVAMVKEHYKNATASTGYSVLRVKQSLNADYLFFWVRSKAFISDMEAKATGASYPAVSDKIIRESRIPLPPLEEQKKIAAILDAADDYRQKTKALIDKYDQLTQSLFLDMFGDPVTNPMGWELKKLGTVHKISSGGTPSRKNPEYYSNGTIPWVKTGELKGMYALESSEYITEEGLNNSSAKLFPANTLLIAMYGATIGACSILNLEAATNQACAALIPTDEVNVLYEYFFFSLYKNELIKLGVGGAQPNISAGILKSLSVMYPPLQLQNQFAERVAQIEKQKQQAEASLVKAEELFSSLLQRAFKGELTS